MMIRIPKLETYRFLILISVLLGLFYQILGDNTVLKILSLFFGVSSIILYYTKYKGNRLLNLWLLFVAYLFFIGIIESLPHWPTSSYTFLRTDLTTVMYIALGLTIVDESAASDRTVIMKFVMVICAITGIYAIFHFRGTITQLTYRYNGLNYDNYDLFNVTGLCSIYAGYRALFYKEDRTLGILVFTIYLILGILFQKRAVVVDFVVLVIIYSLFYIKNASKEERIRRVFKIIALLLLLIILLFIIYIKVPIIHAMIDQIYIRMTDIGQNSSLKTYDRQREANYYLESSSVFEIIFGYGLGHYLTSPSWGIYTGLHIGAYNLLYKGGVVYAGIWVYILFRTLYVLKFAKYANKYTIMCLCITVSALISLLFEFSWSVTIHKICYIPFIGWICTWHPDNSKI